MMKTLHTFFLLVAFVLAKAQSPTITFDDVNASYGDAPFYMTASSNSSGAFTYSVLNTAIASIDQSGLVTIKKAGTTTITVTQGASTPYTGLSKTATLVVYKADVWAVNITSANTISANDSLSLTATSNFADAKYSFMIKSQSGTNATIKGAKLYAGANTGTLNIIGEVVADDNFNATTGTSSIVQTIRVQASSGTPEITFDDVNASYGDAPFYMTASSNSSGAMSYSIVSGTAAAITPEGLVTIKSAGTVTISMSQVAKGSYASGTKTANLTVGKAKIVAINMLSAEIVKTNDSLQLEAVSNPPGAKYRWSVSNQNGTAATISNSKFYAGNIAGYITIMAEVVADDNFELSTSSNVLQFGIDILPSSVDEAIIVDDQLRTYGDAPFNLNPTLVSSGALSYISDNEAIVTVDAEGLVTIKKAGTTTITIQQEAINIFPAYTKKVLLTIDKALGYPQSIVSKNILAANDSMELKAITYPSDAKVKWTILEQNGTDCHVVGSKLLAGSLTGNVMLKAFVLEDENIFTDTLSNSYTFIVNIDPSSGLPIIHSSSIQKTFGEEPFVFEAYSISNAPLKYKIKSGSAATIDSVTGLVTLLSHGVVEIESSQSASGSFSATNKVDTLYINKPYLADLVIDAPEIVLINDSLSLSANSNPSPQKVTWSILSQNGTNAYFVGNKFYSGVDTGYVEILVELEQEGFEKTPITKTITVSRYLTPTISPSNIYMVYRDTTFNINASSVSKGLFTYTIEDESIASIDSLGFITLKKPGSTTITINQTADGNYSAASTAILLNIDSPHILYAYDITINYGDINFMYLNFTTVSPGKLSYSVANDSIISIDDLGGVTVKRAGVTTIKVSQAASYPYVAVSKTVTFTVNKAKTNVYSLAITSMNSGLVNDSISLTAVTNPVGPKVKWSIAKQTGTLATIKGNTLYTGTGTGYLDVVAEVVPDDNYEIYTVSSTLASSLTAKQTITIINPENPYLVFNDRTIQYSNDYLNLYASSNSYGLRTYRLLSGTAAAVDPDGKLTILGLGTVTVQVTQAAYPPYKSASKTATVTIVKSEIYIFDWSSAGWSYFNDTILMAVANDTLSFNTNVKPRNATLEFSIENQNGTSALLKGNKLYTGTNLGTFTLMLKAVVNDYYDESIVRRIIKIVPQQTTEMTFKDTSIVYGQNSFRLNANSNNPSYIEYSLVSGNAAIIYSGDRVEIKGVGSVTVKATQAAYPPFSAVSKTAVLTIQKATPVITVTSRDDVRWNDSLLLTATSYPTGANIKWSILSQHGTNATIIGNKLYAGSQKGTLEIKAIIEGDSNFYPASSESMIVGVDSIIKATITVNNGLNYYYNDYLYSTYGTVPFNVIATSNSSGAFSYSVANDSVIKISPTGLVTIVKPGIAMITISQAATPTFKATTKSFAIQIYKAVPSIKITSANTVNISDSLNLTATSTPAGAKIKWIVSTQSGTNSTIIGSKLYAGTSVGILDIRAEVVPDDYFAYGYVGTSTNGYSSSDYQTIRVNGTSGTPTILFPNSYNNFLCSYCVETYTMKATSNSSGLFSYTISGEPSAKINSNGEIMFENPDSLRSALMSIGKYQIVLTVTAHQEASPPYDSASKTATFYLYTAIITGNEESNASFSKPTAYPNPAKDILQIKSGKGAGCEANISLYNMNGIEQNTTSTRNGDDYQVDISELSSGVYSLKMTYCNEVFTQKVVKQ